MKTYVGLVRDHSASMRTLSRKAMEDYNSTVGGIKSSIGADHTAYLTTVECGSGNSSQAKLVEAINPLSETKPITVYETNGGGTPLWDSVGLLIETLEKIPVVESDNTAFLVMVTTDGEENASRQWTARTLQEKMRKLQATDRWTFVFRVPVGYKNNLVRMGISDGNVIEWNQTEAGLVRSSEQTVTGIQNYFSERSRGATRSNTFYADLANVSKAEINSALQEVTNEYKRVYVPNKYDKAAIKDFCVDTVGKYTVGDAYYQLTKPETVQDKKTICILDRYSGKIYRGHHARSLLGLPAYGSIKVAPGNSGNYDIFVQSTSVNRKLVKDTYVLYKNK
jgi:hypothetical protein